MRYYINQEILSKGKTSSEFKRIRSDHIDKVVTDTVNTIINQLAGGVSRSKNPEVSNTILKQLQQLKITPQNFISKVILYPQHLELILSLDKREQTLSAEALSEIKNILADKLGDKYTVNATSDTLLQLKGNIEIQYKRFGGQLFIIKNGDQLETDIEKQSYYPEDKTFIFIAKGFYWSKLIRQGVYKSSSEIAAAHDHSVEYVKRALRQRYLPPELIKHIANNQKEGKQVGVDQLINMNNWDWEIQL